MSVPTHYLRRALTKGATKGNYYSSLTVKNQGCIRFKPKLCFNSNKKAVFMLKYLLMSWVQLSKIFERKIVVIFFNT